jgi:hypothetical protein
MVRVPQRLQNILREVMDKRQPGLLTHLTPAGELSLDAQQRFDLQQALGDELSDTGLGPDDEPNERGYAIEELIDLVGKA